MYGLVVYAGHDTKLVQNSGKWRVGGGDCVHVHTEVCSAVRRYAVLVGMQCL